MEYQKVLQKLYKLKAFGSRLGLSRIRELERRLGRPSRKFRCILVAGSNGKGSVALMIARGLQAEGYRTGLYLSPHLDDFRERISVNGRRISKRAVVKEYELVNKIAEGMKSKPTFFELITAMALDYYARRKAEWAVLESGMGGRLDATNVVEPELSVITRIDLEHTRRLGKTLERIAHEKAGVMRSGKKVVTGAEGRGLKQLKREAEKKGAELKVVEGKYASRVGMTGEYQRRNAAIASRALRELGVSKKAIASGIANAKLAGRFEIVRKRPLEIHDSAHNPAGMKVLAREVSKRKFRRLILVFGVMKDKEYEKMLKNIAPLADEVIVNEPALERSAKAEQVARIARKYNKQTRVVEDVRASVREARKSAGKEGVVLITGSLYMLAEARGRD